MYEIFIERNAEKELDKLESGTFDTITNSISNLAEEPRPSGCRKLQGSTNEWRIREGDYRIIYEINDKDKTINILKVRHRKDAYR